MRPAAARQHASVRTATNQPTDAGQPEQGPCVKRESPNREPADPVAKHQDDAMNRQRKQANPEDHPTGRVAHGFGRGGHEPADCSRPHP